jgi:formylglycine-generating enzyme required for sulfatase activity
VRTVALAVEAAHRAGIVHRDLKPANVLLSAACSLAVPKVADFGLARRIDVPDGVTRTGAVLGTPSYMAPEQARGSKQVDPAADTWALGAILYECLTGRPPFRAASVLETLHQVVNDEPVPPSRLCPRLPRDLETIALECLHKDPARRYASAGNLAADLERFLAGAPIHARPVGTAERAVKWARRRPALAGLLLVVVLLSVGGSALVTWQWRIATAALKGERAARREQALAQVEALLRARPEAVPELLAALPADDPEVRDALRRVWEGDAIPRPRRVRAGLALLAHDPEGVRGQLIRWMLQANDPAEMLLVRDALRPAGPAVAPDLWRQLEQARDPQRRLRLLAALAAFDPNSPRWPRAAEGSLEPLVASNPLRLGAWVEALRPVGSAWLGPLGDVFRGRRVPGKRDVAAGILAVYAAEDGALLADLVCDADARQAAILYPVVAARRRAVLPLLRRTAEHDSSALRRATAAAVLARLGVEEPAWNLLKRRPDPTTRSHLVERLHSHGVEAGRVLARLAAEEDPFVRRALILALGEYGEDQLPAPVRARWAERLLVWYRNDPDAGIHSAIDWLLRQGTGGPVPRPLDWGQRAALERADRELASPVASGPGGKRWLVNGQGQTFTLVHGPVQVRMGSPPDEPGRDPGERLVRKRIPRSFAVATRAVTVAEFRRFLSAHPEVKHEEGPRKFSPDPDCPVSSVTWYEAIAYCRWLSDQEKVPYDEMCYPRVAEIGPDMKLHPDYLRRTGYRLPTEAEWEYSCRAGAVTSRCYGDAESLLDRYAWSLSNARNRSWPVGLLRPNDLGLFDAQGNVWNWLHDRHRPLRDGDDVEDEELGMANDHPRALRGGSFFVVGPDIRCAYRFQFRPSHRFYSDGFRVARTVR